MAVDAGVGIDLGVAGATGHQVIAEAVGQAAQSGQVHATMRQLQVGQRGRCGLAPLQRRTKTADQQSIFDSIEPLRTFGVTGTHLVAPAIGVGEIPGDQAH